MQIKIKKMIKSRIKNNLEKKRLCRFLIVLLALAVLSIIQISAVKAFAGKICGSASPCNCGSNCSGANELFGQTQSYCDSNPIECFNTIDDCRDGTIVAYNYVKDINVTSLNDSVFRIGDTILIDATLYSSSVNTEGVFFVYTNSSGNSSVNWSAIYSASFGASDSNYHIKINYTIPNRIGDHSVRIIDEFNTYKNITCGRDASADFPAYSDTDDVTFTVLPQPAPKINFTGPTPANSSTQTTVTVTINVTHNETHPDTLILNWNGTNESQSYSGGHTVITKYNLRQGNYSFYVWVNDTFGNSNQTETRIIEINTPIDITIDTPTNNQLFRNNTINLNITAKPTQSDKNITWVRFQLNSNNNVTVTSLLNISADASDPNGIINESLISFPNLSQSFVPNQLMEITNISIRLKRAGLPNASIQIRADNDNNPSETVLANASINNASVSDSVFSWINITFNSTITLQNKTRYWLFLSPNGSSDDYYAWEASDENISKEGELLQNGSRDLLFRIFDLYKYRTTFTAAEGSNNLSVYANNTDNAIVTSSTITFVSDTIPPTYEEINESNDPVEIGNNITISINVSDASSSVNTVLIEYNSTNHKNYTMTIGTGNRYNFTFIATQLGLNNYTFYINDSVGNLNTSLVFNFTVVDTRAPEFSNIANSPNTSDELDPNVLINVTVTISDLGGISNAVLQYINSTASDWSNVTMSNSSSLFYANFTPNAPSNWTYRVWANDTSGNSNYSTNSSLDVSYDYTWTRSPGSYNAMSGIKGSVVTIGNLTINNTGDYLLGFDITTVPTFVSLNLTTPFTIEPHNYTVIEVNATTPLTESEYSIQITIDAQNATASPDYLQTNATLVAISSGPYLFVEIIQYNASLKIGDFTDLKARVTNIGNETAINVTSNWTLPSGWTPLPLDLNKTLGNISINKFEYHNISADITSSASTGSQTISIYAQSRQGANNTASKTVSVSSATTPSTPSTTPSGGSGPSTSGGGGGAVVYIKPSYDILIEAPKKIELLADQKGFVEINITNNASDTILENIKTAISGFLLSRLNIEPKAIEKLNYSEKKKIMLSIDVPKYMKYQNITLVLTFTSNARDTRDNPNDTKSHSIFEKKAEINLVILEITREVALQSLSKAQMEISFMKAQRFNTIQAEELLSDAKNAFEESNYVKVKELSDRITALKEKAVLANALIEKAKEKIEGSKEKGYDVKDAEGLLQLATDLFQKGNFEESEETVNKALLSERLSAKIEEARISRILLGFIKDYWMHLSIALMLLAGTGLLLRKEFSIKAIANRLKVLEKEESTLNDLIKRAQEEYFKDRLMSDRLYSKTMGQYVKSMTELQKRKVNLNSKKIGILKRSTNIESLQKEKSAIKQLMEELQKKYFVDKIITKEIYNSSITEYKKREAELEKALQMLSKSPEIPKKTPLKYKEGYKEKEEHKEQLNLQDSELNKVIEQLKTKKSQLAQEIADLEKNSIDLSSIRKMMSILDTIIKKLANQHKEDESVLYSINSYNDFLKKYGESLKLKINFFKFFPILKKTNEYYNIKLHMLKSFKEVYKHGH